MTRHFSVTRFCARLFLFRHAINDSLIIIITGIASRAMQTATWDPKSQQPCVDRSRIKVAMLKYSAVRLMQVLAWLESLKTHDVRCEGTCCTVACYQTVMFNHLAAWLHANLFI